MKKMQFLNIDGELLLTFVTVYEELSIINAANRLNQNPSTLSHRLERLRQISGDKLFVRAGRGILPTVRARNIIDEARVALNSLKCFVEDEVFDPFTLEGTFVVGITDLELSAFLIDVHKQVLQQAPKLRIDFVWNQYENATKALRNNYFDFILSPNSSMNDTDIITRTLMRDTPVCYYDPSCRDAPNTLKEYLKARHIGVMFSAHDVNHTDVALHKINSKRQSVVTLPSYSEVPHFLQGTNLVATLPARLGSYLMKDFATCPPPFLMDTYDYSLFWHESSNQSLKHMWLRDQIFAASQKL